MIDFKAVVNAALKFLEKRIVAASLQVTKSVDRLSGSLEKQADTQSRALAKLGAQFEAATKRMEKPTFDVAVDLEPLLEELRGIGDELAKLGAKDGPDLQMAEAYLKLILEAIERNAPEKIGEKIDAMDAVFKGLKPKDTVKFDDKQMRGLMAALTSGRGGGGGNKSAINWDVVRIPLALADTEYSYTFPANTVSWTMKLRGTTAKFYYASEAGKLPVSGDNTAYMTVPANGTRSQDNVEYGGKTMYFETNTASQDIELEVFTM